ncbi:MAG TPA: phage tail sheath family protein, partial [Pseudonocardiaceae bacterium]|nr:phage tail sheath family protein [Pseudonocardiaceae bacterium]
MPSYLSPGVYVEEVSSGARPIEGVGTALCAFVGFTERGPANEPILVTNWTQYTNNFGGFVAGAYLPQSVFGYFLNGGGSAYVVSVGALGTDESANGAKPIEAATAELTSGADSARPGFTVRAIAEGAAGQGLDVEITDASDATDDTFKLVVHRGTEVVETFDNLTTKRGANNVVAAVRQQSKLIRVEESKGGPVAVPRKGVRTPIAVPDTPNIPAVTADAYVGDTSQRTGFAGLEAIEDITMLCVPDAMSAYQAGVLDDEGLKAVQLAMIA